jgi:hypothetical protein
VGDYDRIVSMYLLLLNRYVAEFNTSSRMGTGISYIPLIRPGGFSVLRKFAYLKEGRLPGPEDDPGGWKSLETVNIHVTIFGRRSTSVLSTVSG